MSTLLVALALAPSMLGVFTRGGSATAFDESITTYAANCSNAQPGNSWNLGGTACAVATGSPEDRRIVWVAPDGTVAQVTGFYSGTLTDSYTIHTGSDPLAQVGTWTVQTVDPSGATFAAAEFTVRDPANASANLSVADFGPFQTSAGNNVNYRIELTNTGPDDAQLVVLTSSIPGDTTFVSETQDSGPAFTCTTPAAGAASGAINCSIASLAPNTTAVFTLVFNVNSGTPNGAIITDTASASSSTNDPQNANNSASTSTTVVSATSNCTVTCPSVAPVSTTQCSAVVTYAAPTTSGSCGSNPEGGSGVVCSPPSGSTFPLGSTAIACTAMTGDTCSFTVTVNFTGSTSTLSINCPGDVTVTADTSGGTAVVTYPAPTTTGSCVTVACSPPSGSVFTVGTTAVTCTATDAFNSTQNCTFNAIVSSGGGGGCTVTCPGDITQTTTQCSGVAVTYPAPTTSGTCGTVSCDPPSGSTFTVGTTLVTCTSTAGPDCDFTVTITAPAAPTITTCATNKTVSVNAICEAAIPNLVGEVVATGCGVVISQSPAAGSIVGPGTYAVTITAENSAGEVTCTATVTVADTTPPVITSSCPAGTSASANSNCQAQVPNVIGGVTATDNCTDAGSLTITQSPAAGTPVGVGTTTITITVKDAANNAAACATTFTVSDTTPPTAVCKNITVALNASGNASITAANVDNGSSDNCGITSRTVSPSTFTCANKGANTVTLTVKDAANNTSTCQATVTVVDNTPPTIACVADIIVDFDPAVNGAVVTYATPVGTDNCPGATTALIAGLASGATFPVGATTNTFRVTDGAGLTAQCSFKVTVALTSIIGLDSVSITGAALVDSYNSTGGYPATKSSLANVLSNGTITLGNSGKVSGNVRSTRAGVAMSGASQVTGNATAGTTVSRSGSATVGGTITNNQLAPVMTLPSVSACGPPYSPNTGISGTYSYNPGTGDLSLSGVNIATLANGTYCFHNVTLTNSAQLRINGPVVIKMTGTWNASGATTVSNTTAIPSNLRILSSYSGNNGVTFSNGTNAYLVIYAPNTGVSISGTAPLFGTVAGKTVTLANSGMLHYDILLKNIWPEIWSLIP